MNPTFLNSGLRLNQFMRNLDTSQQEMGGAGRLLRTGMDHGETGVSMGTSVAGGTGVSVSTGGWVAGIGVSEGGMNTCVSVGVLIDVLVGSTKMGGVDEGATGDQGGT